MNTADDPLNPQRGGPDKANPSLIHEDDLLDFRDDTESNLCEAEEILIRFENTKGTTGDLNRLVFLLNRVRGSAEVVGVRWVADLARMLEDILRRCQETGQTGAVAPLVESYCGGFDAIRHYVDAVLEDKHDESDPRALAIRSIYTDMKAERERLDQTKVDRILEEFGI